MNKARSVCCTPAGRRTAAADASTAVPMVVSMATADEPSRRLDATDMAPLLHNSTPPLSRASQPHPSSPSLGSPSLGSPSLGSPSLGSPSLGSRVCGKLYRTKPHVAGLLRETDHPSPDRAMKNF